MDYQVQTRRADAEAASPAPWLFVAEIEHRIANEYALAIASISPAASRSVDLEARVALRSTAQRLRDYADGHRSLQAPAVAGEVDVATYIGQLCHALSRATLDGRAVLGRGGQVGGALAQELGGFVERRYGAHGTTVVLSFPEHDPNVTTPWSFTSRDRGLRVLNQ